MDPLTLSAIFGTVTQGADALYKLVTGDKQKKLAEEYEKTPRPVMGIPGAMLESEDIARNRFLDTKMPGQTGIEDKIQAQSANATGAAKEMGGPQSLAAISAINANQNNAMADLGVQAAQQQIGDSQNLQSTLDQKAGYQEKVFDYNKNQPYQQAMAAASALKEAAGHNNYAGFRSAMGATGNIGGAMYAKVLGKQQNQLAMSDEDIAGMDEAAKAFFAK